MPKQQPQLDLDIVDVKELEVTANAQGEAILSIEIAGGQTLNLIFSPETFGKLEALLAKANEEQAKVAPKQ